MRSLERRKRMPRLKKQARVNEKKKAKARVKVKARAISPAINPDKTVSRGINPENKEETIKERSHRKAVHMAEAKFKTVKPR